MSFVSLSSRLKRYALASLSAAVALPAFAQKIDSTNPLSLANSGQALSQVKVDSWQTDQGLPINTVQALLQTRSGHLWVGTAAGLARFDGLRFTVVEAQDIPELTNKAIFGLSEDSEGALWIGSFYGAVRYKDGIYERVIVPEQTERSRVWGFAEAADGTMWASSENGLFHLTRGKDKKYVVEKVFRKDDGLPVNKLRNLCFDKAGVLWIATTGGGLVAMVDGKFKIFDKESGFAHNEVRNVLADTQSGVWAATAGGGLVHMKDATGNASITYNEKNGLPSNQLTALTRDASGALWIGTWGAGVVRLQDGTFSQLDSKGGLAGDQIWSIHVDREKTVWVGTWVAGLNRLRVREFPLIGKPEGLSDDRVRSVLHARDGSAWITTAGGGANRIVNGAVQVIGKAEGLSTLETSTLFEDRDGAVWIGTYTDGVARWKDGKVERFPATLGLPDVSVRTIYQTRDGTLWFGTPRGAAKWVDNRFEPLTGANVPEHGVTSIIESKDGTLWLGTSGGGLLKVTKGQVTLLTRKEGLLTNWVLSLYEDADGAVWVGSASEGITRIQQGQLASIKPADGLADGVIQTLIEDKAGHFWVTFNRGFFCVARKDLNAFIDKKIPRVTSFAFGPGDGLRSTTFVSGVQPAGAMDPAGRLWLPTFNSVVIVDPTKLRGAFIAPQVSIDEIFVNGQQIGASDVVRLPPGAVPLSLRYFAATLNNANRVRFRYRLEGVSRDWVNVGTNRESYFPTLPSGEHRFQVAASVDGVQWSPEAQLTIDVQPHFWETTWFKLASVLGLIASAVGIYLLRTRALRTRHAQMEKLVAEKTDQLQLANEHLTRLSLSDALTGLANRRRLDEVLEVEWQRAARTQSTLAIIMMDIDAFKKLNDTMGHQHGDKCLSVVGQVIANETKRPGDCAGRYGGEEFMVILPGTDGAQAQALAEQLRAACESRGVAHPASPVGPVVTISAGVAACVPVPGSSSSALVEAADNALYQSKELGRNRVSLSPYQPRANARGKTESVSENVQ